jgi:hypothetical protein
MVGQAVKRMPRIRPDMRAMIVRDDVFEIGGDVPREIRVRRIRRSWRRSRRWKPARRSGIAIRASAGATHFNRIRRMPVAIRECHRV